MEVFANLAIGLLVPIVVSYLKDQGWPDALKLALSLGISILVGAATTWVAGQADGTPWTWQDFAANSGLVFTAATAFYKTIFQGVNFNRETLEPGGPFATGRTPPIERPDNLTRYLDRAGNEVDPMYDLDEDDRKRHTARDRKSVV